MSDEDRSPYDPSDPRWDSDEALDNLKMERSVNPDETDEQLAKRLLQEAAPQAAMSIIHLAVHATNENTRLNASRYITDKLYEEGAQATRSKWEELVGEVVSDAEVHANVGSSEQED